MGERRASTVRSALGLGAVTAAAVTVPLWLMLVHLVVAVDLASAPTWVSVLVGAALMLALLALPAVAWGWTVARLAGAPPRPVVRATVRMGLLLAVPVGLGVDLSQLLIDVVWQWHRLAVHVVFTVAFALGLAVFLGRVSRRVVMEVPNGPPPGPTGWSVAAATAAGVVLGAVVAIPLDWAVVVAMGRRMLQPLFLVLVTGMAAGGATLGAALAAHRPVGVGADVPPAVVGGSA